MRSLFCAALSALLLLSACEDQKESGQAGACNPNGYGTLVGKSIAAITLPADRDIRVITPGMAVTLDYNPERLNIEIDQTGVIRRVYCG